MNTEFLAEIEFAIKSSRKLEGEKSIFLKLEILQEEVIESLIRAKEALDKPFHVTKESGVINVGSSFVAKNRLSQKLTGILNEAFEFRKKLMERAG